MNNENSVNSNVVELKLRGGKIIRFD